MELLEILSSFVYVNWEVGVSSTLEIMKWSERNNVIQRMTVLTTLFHSDVAVSVESKEKNIFLKKIQTLYTLHRSRSVHQKEANHIVRYLSCFQLAKRATYMTVPVKHL